jgi:hypothetical protein
LFLKDDIQESDLILVTSPDDAPVWYYSRLYGIADAHFDNMRPFNRAFMIVNPAEQQTPESVFRSRSPLPLWLRSQQPLPSDIENARLIQTVGD